MSNKLHFKIDRDFTIIPNAVLKDRRLSNKAKGIFMQILALPEGWNFSVKGLTVLSKDSERSVTSGLNELVENGYLEWTKKRTITNQFCVEVNVMLPDPSAISPYGKTPQGKTPQGKTVDNKESKNKELKNKELNNLNKGIYKNEDSSLEPGEQVDWENLDYTLWNKI